MTARRDQRQWSAGAAGPVLKAEPKTHCVNDHEYTPENTYWYKGRRMCCTCRSSRKLRAAEAARHGRPPGPLRPPVPPSLVLAGPYQPTGWRARGACKDMDPELFFPAQGHSPDEAKAACNSKCPVRERCLELALSVPPDDDKHGVFGGTTPNERQNLRRARRRQEAAA